MLDYASIRVAPPTHISVNHIGPHGLKNSFCVNLN